MAVSELDYKWIGISIIQLSKKKKKKPEETSTLCTTCGKRLQEQGHQGISGVIHVKDGLAEILLLS
ncbi:MAG: hypothetical protein ACYDAJ_02915 [Nitrosotalea sp.]